jgi:iron(III) transport system ATP-binding protein
MTTELHVRGLTASYGTTQVLDGLDLDVPGGITAVLGASGCGKTTLLRLVAGFLKPAAGTIRIGDDLVAGPGCFVPPRRRRTGYVPQEGALFPHLSVAGNIAFGLPARTRRTAAGRARVDEMLDLIELPRSAATRQPHELSGGQQQRVALARALAPEPALVLLDEPFSSLDATLREETGRAVARALRASGATAVLVTHDQGEALSLADQVAVMEAGRVLQVGAPAHVYLEPATPAVASFVGRAALVGACAADGVATAPVGTVRVRGTREGEVLLAVRPEQVAIVPTSPRLSLEPAGEIVEVSFFGHDATVRVQLDQADEGPITVTARVPADGVPEIGTRVGIRVVGEVLAFPRDESR